MTVTAKCLLEAKQAENAQTTQYSTPTGTRTIIDKFSARSAAGATLSVNIVASGGAAGATNLIVTKTLAAGEQYTFPELVGQVLNAGDFISTISSVATDTVIRISGRENT
jgi:hypothetical protein